MIDLERARAFLKDRRHGMLATIRRDGRPQLSNILYVLDDDGRIKISVTQTRAKTKNLRRHPRAALHAQGRDACESTAAHRATIEHAYGQLPGRRPSRVAL